MCCEARSLFLAKGNMMHQKTNRDVASTSSSSTKQDGGAPKRPRSFYSSNIKSWASRHSEQGGNPNGSRTQIGVGRCDVIADSSKQAEQDGSHRVNGFSMVIDCESVGEESPKRAKMCTSIGSEGIINCDVVICDSDDDLTDCQKLQDPQKDVQANHDPPSDMAQKLSKVSSQNAFSPCTKVTSKTASDNMQSSSPLEMVLEIESDDDDRDGESSLNITSSSKSLSSNADFSSHQPPANQPSQVSSPVIEIDSDSCSSIRDSVPSQDSALQNYSISRSIESRHRKNTPTLSVPTSKQRNPHGVGFVGFPNTHVAPVLQYPASFQGAFQNYCGSDKTSSGTFAASYPSNGGASVSISTDSSAIGADNSSQEHLLALLKSGRFSFQFIAGIPVLCPTNFAPTTFALPFDGSGLQPNMKTVGSIFSPSLLTDTVGYGTDRGTLLLPGPASTAPSSNTVGNGARRRILESPAPAERSLSGIQSSSSFSARDSRQKLPQANMNKADLNVGMKNKSNVVMILSRKRTRTSSDSPNKKAKDKATTVEPKVSKDKVNKDIIDKTNGDKERTAKDSNKKNKPNKDTAEKAKKDGERPVAKVLTDLASRLVSKQVIVGLIKVTKRNLEEKPEAENLLMRFQNRHVELKRETEAFALKTKECTCGRFKTESSNVLLEHLQHGCSTRVYRCCFCLRITQSHRTFRQHMARLHKIVGGQKLDEPKNFSCSICPFDTNHQATFDAHSKRCHRLLQMERNLHPSLEDFDIPIMLEERKRRQIAKEISLAASIGLKTNQYYHLNRNLGVLCRTCCKSFSNSRALRRHRKSAHKMPDPGSGGTPLKQATPAKILGSMTPSSKKLTTNADRQTDSNTIKCCLCDEILGREMVQHFRMQHHITLYTMSKKHFCYFCDCSLQNFKYFEEHMMRTHNNIFPDLKTLWHKILASIKVKERDTLIAYDTTSGSHDAVAQPWQCLCCKKRFLSASFCYRHAVLFHTTAKIECQLCPKMIATGATYTQHLQQCHIRKCCVLIEQLSLPSANTTPKTAAVQLIHLPETLPTFDDEMDTEPYESSVASPKIESPSITSLGQDFPILDEKDGSLQPAAVCF